MSEDRHPDLEAFYDALNAQDEDDTDNDDGDFIYQEYDDDEDDMGEDMDEDGDIDMDIFDEDDEEEEDDGEDDEDMGNATLLTGDAEEDDDDDEATMLDFARILNQAGGDSAERRSLLERLLAGPAGGRGLASLLRRQTGQRVSDEERARMLAERRRRERWWTPQTEPNKKGVELLNSGEFGIVGGWKAGRRVRVRGGDLRMRRGYIKPTAKVGYSRQLDG
jgi:WD repeat-containing protein 23